MVTFSQALSIKSDFLCEQSDYLRFSTLDHLHLVWCESSIVKTIAYEFKLQPSTHITCKNLPGGAQSVNCGFIALSCKHYNERNAVPLPEVHNTAGAL
jgi:hypothetical protein